MARALPGRTDDQCAKRYKEAVDPSISKLDSLSPFLRIDTSSFQGGTLG